MIGFTSKLRQRFLVASKGFMLHAVLVAKHKRRVDQDLTYSLPDSVHQIQTIKQS